LQSALSLYDSPYSLTLCFGGAFDKGGKRGGGTPSGRQPHRNEAKSNGLLLLLILLRLSAASLTFEKPLILLAHPAGVEPAKSANKHKGILRDGHKNGHINFVSEDSDLQKVVTAWPLLPPPLKAAVLALVRTACGKGVGNERK
jgi:hypothetical protein